jgi:hypothetical protein
MTAGHDENLMRAAFSGVRDLEPTEAEIAAVVARARRVDRPATRRARTLAAPPWRRLAAPALLALLLLAGLAYAVPQTRAAIDDIASTLSDWVSGDSSEAPGRPLGANEQAPAYFHDQRYARDPRVIAAADGYRLYAALMPGGGVQFDLGNTGVGLGFEASAFDERALYVLGPGAMENADESGHVPLFGVTARPVSSVELTYESGPPLRVDDVDGGFVLLAEPDRAPREVIAFDRQGNEVGRELVDDSQHYGPRIDWSHYGPPAPRVSSECQPGAVGRNPPPRCR